MQRWTRSKPLPAAALLALLLVGSPSMVTARDSLTLRINDAIAEPGGLAAVVIRTYASRPVGQGQVCFLARGAGAAAAGEGSPFASLEGQVIFSKRGDALSIASIESSPDGQMIFVEFSSASATINKKDGPLAVLYFRLPDDAEPRQRFRLGIDVANTVLFDARGEPIEIEPRGGELIVRRTSQAFKAGAEDDKVVPGETAELGMETYEPVGLAEGQIGLRFDPDVVDGRIKVKMRKQHGRRRFRADRSTPGLVLVNFRSKDASLNLVPGEILSVLVPTARDRRIGSGSRVWIDPALTFFEDAEGDLLPFEFEDGRLEFEAD